MSSTIETFEFQTEARQRLDLMIHSVYSNQEIFLRELISNSSDALDRRRFEAVQNPDLFPGDSELRIFLEPNPAENTLTVHDNGIGMSREEVIELIGTIAKSGTQEFLAKLRDQKDAAGAPELIGQFGIGFYSSFMVAEKVSMLTRKAGEEGATRWESTGDGSYTLEEAERDESGTSITLHLRTPEEDGDTSNYTEELVIRGVVKKYSDFVAYPIQMNIERTEVERDEEGKVKEGAKEKTAIELETLNSMKAIWLRDKDELSDDDLNEFYKHISHDWNPPMETIAAKIEGTLEYRLLLFIPATAPFDLYYREGKSGLHLYVKRVFIMDDCKELIPEYLRFVKGILDSEDLSLNISREMLQQNRQIGRMRKGVANKILDSLKKIQSNDEEKYLKFWGQFGVVLKEGIYSDLDNREALLNLAMFESTAHETNLTTLKDYVERMKPDQDTIYYMPGETRTSIENSPHLETFQDKGYEVILLTDPVDEIWVQSTFEHDGKKLQSAGKGTVELGSEDEKQKQEEDRKEKEKEYGSLLESIKATLDEHVKEVRLSARLTTSAACLVGENTDMSPQLEKLMKSMSQEVSATKRILELNAEHPVLKKMQGLFDEDASSPAIGDYAQLLYGQALLSEGAQLPDPALFSRLVTDLMVNTP